MALLTLRKLLLSYGDPPLIDAIDLSIEVGERVCLLGRNGEGKSTLLRLIAGELDADDGERVFRQGATAARMPQSVPREIHGCVFDVVAEGVGATAELVKRYHAATLALAAAADAAALARLEQLQHQLEAADGWRLEQQVERIISRMQLEPEAEFADLSGGMQRRVLLARALVNEPDLLLLDEPTNHLDVDAIGWLESFLRSWSGTLIFITHDREFLRALATRIVELDRGRLTDYPCDYDTFLQRREALAEADAQALARFDKRLAQEEIWIRQGIKARRTRNEGRVRRLEAMRQSYRERREAQGSARMQMNVADRSGRLVCRAEHIGYAWRDDTIVDDFSTTILRGDRIGIIGPNGCGKTTLLNLLLGRLEPDRGSVTLGTRLEVAYFDQMRTQLEPAKSVLDNVAGGSEQLLINGKSRHVISYLRDFLFPPRRCRQPVAALSGGERNRLLLARLFAQPANLLVLDEPTNDLDLETLELLEELLLDFDGTLLLVSHDRAFLDNVVTGTLAFEGAGRVAGYVGGYRDWLRQRPQLASAVDPQRTTAAPRQQPSPDDSVASAPRKLGYREQRELAALPERIEALEAELAEVQSRLGDPDLYREHPQQVASQRARLAELEAELANAYRRWEALEG